MNVLSFNSSRNFTLIFGILFFLGTILRFYYTPFQLPLTLDALDNFTYASSINFYQNLPTEWSPPNIGWPLTLSFFFSIISLDNTLEYMQLQRLISIILSSLIFIPVYFLCRRFFNEKISIIGASLFLFEPRIILNSTLGITEPIFIP